MKVLLCNTQSETFHHTYIGYVVSTSSRKLRCIESNPTPGDDTVLIGNFDDMAFAHMQKDYSASVSRLSYAIQKCFVSML